MKIYSYQGNMSRIAGIIYPSAFQVTEMVREMDPLSSSQSVFQYFHHKNVELGAWNTELVTNLAKDTWALLDGEIYNKKALRKELNNLGFEFQTESDTELIVHAYEAWKEDFLHRLNGPFALAIFDEKKQHLLLARDRLGQKPLYWATQGEYWLFSTELKGLLATGIVPQTPSISGLASYLYFGFIPQDFSAIQGVNKLLPCHYLKVNLNRQFLINQYWSLSDHLQKKHSLSKEELYEKFGEKLEDAIRLSLPKQGKIGTFLEANLGSSTMNWFLSHLSLRNHLHCYSPTFEKTQINATSEVAHILSLSHETKNIQPEDILDELPKMVWHLDEPLADLRTIQVWNLGKLASEKSTCLYTSLGWEELLGGNSRYFTKNETAPPFAFFLSRLPSKWRNKMVIPFLKLIDSDYFYRILRNIDINREQVSYLTENALFKGKARKKISPLLFKAFDPEVFTQRFHRLSGLPGNISPILYYDTKTELPDSSLIQFERLLSAHDVRVINPFLDHHLIEFLAETPDLIKFENNMPAALLKNLMKELCHHCPSFPEKSDLFINTWRLDTRLRNIFQLLSKGRLVDEGMISGKWIRQQLNDPHLSPQIFKQLWGVLILEVWFRLYIAKPPAIDNANCTTEELLKL